MLKLLGRANSINVQKALWCLNELGLDYERIDVGGPYKFDNVPNYLELNPNGLVPTLIDDDFVLWESHTVVRYLCEKAGDTEIRPADAKRRAIANQWMDWIQYSLPQPHFAVFFSLIRLRPEEWDTQKIEDGRQKWAKCFDIADAQLAKHAYLAGDDFTMADIIMGPYVYRWYTLDIERPTHANVEAYFERLKGRKPFKEFVMLPLS